MSPQVGVQCESASWNISVLFLTRWIYRHKKELVDCHFRYTPSHSHDSLSFFQTTSGWWRWPRASPRCCFPSSGNTSMFPSCQPPSCTFWMLLFPTWWACSPRRAPTAPNWSFLRRYSANLRPVNNYTLYVIQSKENSNESNELVNWLRKFCFTLDEKLISDT